jgi:hypothetical protein
LEKGYRLFFMWSATDVFHLKMLWSDLQSCFRACETTHLVSCTVLWQSYVQTSFCACWKRKGKLRNAVMETHVADTISPPPPPPTAVARVKKCSRMLCGSTAFSWVRDITLGHEVFYIRQSSSLSWLPAA